MFSLPAGSSSTHAPVRPRTISGNSDPGGWTTDGEGIIGEWQSTTAERGEP
jgi:hypothetical protein